MFQLLLLLSVGLIAFVYFFVVKRLLYWKNRNVIQESIPVILKNTYDVLSKRKSIAESSLKGYNSFPDARYVGTYQLVKPVLMIRDPELIKDVTIKSFDHFMDHTNNNIEDDPIWTKNLVILKGQQWRDMRAILSPSFTSSKMRVMFNLISECAENFCKHFLDKNEDIIEVELKKNFIRYTTDVIATTAFGIKVDSMADKDNEFYAVAKEVTNFGKFSILLKSMFIAIFPKLAKILNISFLDRRTKTFFTQLIDDTISLREQKGIIRQDMIHLLMEAKKSNQTKYEHSIDEGFAVAQEAELTPGKTIPRDITNIDITAQALIFFLAGFETVSSTMCFVGYELAANPDYQKRLRDEVLETMEQCQGTVTFEALMKMKYMDMFLSESLRKWPVAIATERQCTKTYTIEPVNPDEKPVVIKKGRSLWMPVFGIHRDPKFHPQPSNFDPERFNDENKAKIKPYTYFPFGLGPRNCIGSRFALLEIKVVFFNLLKHFEIVPIAKSQIPLQISKSNFNLTAEGGFWFGLKRYGS